MGREVRRVAMDFDWPLKKTWHGFLNPYQSCPCPHCSGSGYSPQAKRISDEWYGMAPFSPAAYGAVPLSLESPILLARARRNVEQSPEYYGSGERAVLREAARLHALWIGQWCHHLIQVDVDALCEEGRLQDLTSEWTKDRGWVRTKPNPTAAEVNEWSLSGMGHDSINNWICVEARCKREGVPVKCSACNGEGEIWQSPELKAAHKAWESFGPPVGEGWQAWETTSEGSPISPVFATPEDLARWLADTGASSFGSRTATYEQWLKFIQGPGWAPSAVSQGGEFKSGVEHAADRAR